MEIKWADKRTFPELIKGLEDQLIGQYLRDNQSRYGIYLLGYIGRKNSWEGPAAQSHLSFDQIVSCIKQRARDIVAERRDIADIIVISIDFTAPTRK